MACQEHMRMERLMEESRELTFTPITNSAPGALASTQIRCPEICGSVMHRRYQQHLEHVKNEAHFKEASSSVAPAQQGCPSHFLPAST